MEDGEIWEVQGVSRDAGDGRSGDEINNIIYKYMRSEIERQHTVRTRVHDVLRARKEYPYS